jgi:[acyl-carrier-protein] S-malonyltransferase
MKVGLFPGQGIAAERVLGALTPGDPFVASASEVLGYDLRRKVDIAGRRKGAKLPTALAQPAIFVASIASWRRASEEGRRVDFLAGHSLGEYAALVAGESISFEQGLRAVAARGEAMQAAARATPGGMTAVLGLDLESVEDIARRSGVSVANDNAPGQVVVSGPEGALAEAAVLARSEGGRAVLLDVAGPFHTGAMAPAQAVLRDALDHVDVRSPGLPVVSNVSARPYRAPGEIRALLVSQLTDRVRFRESLLWLWRNGVRDFVDFGPGSVVGGIAQRTFRDQQASEVAVNA